MLHGNALKLILIPSDGTGRATSETHSYLLALETFVASELNSSHEWMKEWEVIHLHLGDEQAAAAATGWIWEEKGCDRDSFIE